MLDIDKIYQGDCLELMKSVPDKSVDAIICDLPFNIHSIVWDKLLDSERMWEQYKRIPQGLIDNHYLVWKKYATRHYVRTILSGTVCDT